jgi:Protein of unknown function (DUF3304)
VTGSARYLFVQQLLLRLRVVFVSGVASVALVACGQTPTINPEASPPQTYGPPVSLAINGFNYTDTVISNFSANGNGGGNIYVSSPTSGGSGTSCCIVWHPITKLPAPVKIVWLRVVNGRDRWCEKTVQLKGPIPDKPTAFGVHFMPDGDIQVEITVGYPKLKLRLENFDGGRRHESGNMIHDEETARCRDGR